jgi:8-oxo-dGTP diphosphatase
MEFTEWDTRLGAYAVITDDRDRILLTWYNGTNPHPMWTLPGGGVDYEESLDDAVVREVHEETGYRVSVGRPLFTSTRTAPVGNRSPRPFKAVRVVFEATILGGELGTTEVGGTTDEARWIPLADFPGIGPRAQIVDEALALLRRPADG